MTEGGRGRPRPLGAAGVTLVELMVVVAIIGILATAAVYTYSKVSKKSKIETEVFGVFSELRIRQGQYQLENGRFLSTGAGEEEPWPAFPSGDEPTTLAPLPAAWVALRLNLDKQAVYCSYVSIAGAASDATNVGAVARDSFGFVPPAADWYYLLAQCDLDHDSGTNSWFFSRSGVEGIAKLNPGK